MRAPLLLLLPLLLNLPAHVSAQGFCVCDGSIASCAACPVGSTIAFVLIPSCTASLPDALFTDPSTEPVFSQVTALFLSGGSGLTAGLPASFFSPPALPALTSLQLSGLPLPGALPPTIFGALEQPALASLSLQNSSFSSIPSLSLVPTLTSLQISDCPALQSLPAGFLAGGGAGGPTGLTSFQLINVGVTVLPVDLFVGQSAASGSLSVTLANMSLGALDPTLWGLNADVAAVTAGSLSLNGLGLSALPPGVFSTLVSLTRLDLSSNALTSIDPADLPVGAPMYSSPPSVGGLFLSNNRLTELPASLLQSIVGTSQLAVDGNALASLPLDLLSYTNALTTLALSGNPLSDLSVTTGLGAVLAASATPPSSPLSLLMNDMRALTTPFPADLFSSTALASLSLANCSLRPGDLPAALLAGQTAITSLTLSSNALATSDVAELLGGIGAPTALAQLDLSSNAITSSSQLDAPFLEFAPSLTSFAMGFNPGITTLPPSFFSTPTGLSYIDLSGCALASLPSGIFSPAAASLASLSLASNKLATLGDAVANLAALSSLDLSFNALTTAGVELGALAGLPALTSLSLAGNQLTALPADVASLSALTTLNVSANSLGSLAGSPFAALGSLETLDVSYNALSVGSLGASTFAGLGSLKYLVMLGCGLSSLPAALLAGVPALEQLNLASNPLGGGLPPCLLSGLRSLTAIGLMNATRLASLPPALCANASAPIAAAACPAGGAASAVFLTGDTALPAGCAGDFPSAAAIPASCFAGDCSGCVGYDASPAATATPTRSASPSRSPAPSSSPSASPTRGLSVTPTRSPSASRVSVSATTSPSPTRSASPASVSPSPSPSRSPASASAAATATPSPTPSASAAPAGSTVVVSSVEIFSGPPGALVAASCASSGALAATQGVIAADRKSVV